MAATTSMDCAMHSWWPAKGEVVSLLLEEGAEVE